MVIKDKGFLGGLDGKESAAMQKTWVRSLGWEGPLEKGNPREFIQSMGVTKSQTRLRDFHFTFTITTLTT